MFKPPRLFGDGEADRPPRFSGRTSGPRSLTTRRATGLRPGWRGVHPAREGRGRRHGAAERDRDGIVSWPLARAATTPPGVRAPAWSPRPRPSRARLYPFPFPFLPSPFSPPPSRLHKPIDPHHVDGSKEVGGRSHVVRPAARPDAPGPPGDLLSGLRKEAGSRVVPRTTSVQETAGPPLPARGFAALAQSKAPSRQEFDAEASDSALNSRENRARNEACVKW